MTGLRAAIATEWLKSRRSRVPLLVFCGFSLVPLIAGLFMVILKDPESARRLGLLGAKAQLAAGTADWPTMLAMLSQAMAVGGAILFAFLTAWVYGREFADRTVRDLLAAPTSRSAIVVAKALVASALMVVTSAWVIVFGLAVGALVGLPGWSVDLATMAVGRIAAAAALTILLQPVTGLAASMGRGYLPGLAWAVLTMVASQVLLVLGIGGAFPWAVPALAAGAAGPDGGDVAPASILLVLVTCAGGLGGLVVWWDRADHTG